MEHFCVMNAYRKIIDGLFEKNKIIHLYLIGENMMDKRRSAKAIIKWDINPSGFQVNEWIRDIVVIFGEIKGKQIIGDTWTVLVNIKGFIENTWDTNADVAFIVDVAPWHLLIKGFSFKFWNGMDIVTVIII